MAKINEIYIDMLPDGRMNSKNAALYIGKTTGRLSIMRMLKNGPKFCRSATGTISYYKHDLDDWLKGSTKKLAD